MNVIASVSVCKAPGNGLPQRQTPRQDSCLPKALSLLAFWRDGRLFMSLRNVYAQTRWACSAILYCLLCGAATNALGATQNQVSQLDTKINAISSETATVSNDVTAAITRLKDESNMSKSVLLVGDIVPCSPGSTVSFDISLVPGKFNPVSLQGTLVMPPGLTLTGIVAGPAAVAAGKQVSSSNGTFLVFGINQTPINSGVVATATFTIAPAVALRPYPISITNPVVSDANGNSLVVSAVSGTIEVK